MELLVPKKIYRNIRFIPRLWGIVLFFDGDQAGRKAAEDAAGVLPPGKVKIARLDTYKDASEALQADDAQAIRKAIWDAKPYQPDGIVEGTSLLELVTTPEPPCAHEYPFKGLQRKQTELDTASLLRLLQEQALERVPFAVNLQLTYYGKRGESRLSGSGRIKQKNSFRSYLYISR